MARLPSAEDLGKRPTPQGRGGISRLQLSTPRRGAEAQAEAQFGQVITGMGDTLGALALKEKERVGSARVEESYTQYNNGLLDMEYGEQNGFDKILGGDAVKQPLVENYREKRKLLADQIRNGLGDNLQKAAFDKRMNIADRQFDARLYRHVSDQSRAYQIQVGEGVFATERASAALNWDQPGQIDMSLLRTDREIERQAQLHGLTDVDAINNQKRVAGTAIHANVMNQMLVTGKDKAAAAYYGQVKDQLTPDAVVSLGAKIDVSSVEGESIRGADTVWATLGPKGADDPIRMDAMETWVRDKYKDDPRIMKAAVQDLRSRAVAFKDQQGEVKATNVAKVLDKFHNGSSLQELQTMPEYQALDGESRVKTRDYIVGRGWTEEQHARSEAQYREGVKSIAGFSAYWELSNPTVLNAMSEAKILNLEPTLGRTLTEDLMQAKRKLSSPENRKAAEIDTNLFNTIADEAKLKPYVKNASEEEKATLGRVRNEVEGAIDQAQRASGRALNRDEKEKLMRSMVDKKVMVDSWGRDPSLPAPAIKPEQRSKIYAPIETIDSGWLKGAINYIRSTEPGTTNWTDEQIKKSMKGRLERGYAISITGGTADEGKKALEGKDSGVRQ